MELMGMTDSGIPRLRNLRAKRKQSHVMRIVKADLLTKVDLLSAISSMNFLIFLFFKCFGCGVENGCM